VPERSRFDDAIAIVAGGVDYGEADRVVHLLTETGRLSAFAHGARKSKRRFQGALEPFQTVRASFDRNHKQGMPTLASCVVTEPRLAIRDELPRIALASYVVELALAVAPEGDPSEELFCLTSRVLDRIAGGSATVALRRAFELRLLDVLGHRPSLEVCVECGAHVDPETQKTRIDLLKGGALCDRHEGGSALGPRTALWIARVLDLDLDDRFAELAGTDTDSAERAARRLASATRAFYDG
jgi:DNA repair protein RecO (recombination protein O)